MKRILCSAALAAVVLALTAPAFAGIHYKASTHQEGEAAAEAMKMVVEAWIDGTNARIEFTESGNPFMGTGTYLLTTDAGQTLYLVNPKDEVYSEWDLDAIFKFAGTIIEGLGGVFKLDFENPKVETLLHEAGGTMLGLPTTHYRFRTSYTMNMKILGMKRSQAVESVQDIWATEALHDPGLGVWLRQEPPKSGNPDLDRLMELERSKMRGFPLKTVEESISEGKKGKQAVTRTIMEVTELDTQKVVDPGLFVIPANYQKTELLPTAEMAAEQGAEEDEQGGKKKGRFRNIFGGGDG